MLSLLFYNLSPLSPSTKICLKEETTCKRRAKQVPQFGNLSGKSLFLLLSSLRYSSQAAETISQGGLPYSVSGRSGMERGKCTMSCLGGVLGVTREGINKHGIFIFFNSRSHNLLIFSLKKNMKNSYEIKRKKRKKNYLILLIYAKI